MNMSDRPAKERADIPEPEPVVLGGTRYEALPWGKARGLPQNGGYLVAIDEANGQEKWLLQVYRVSYDRDMEPDKLDVFISRITPESDRELRIENERGEVYRVDVGTRSVTGPL
jgi:hypothetical protein